MKLGGRRLAQQGIWMANRRLPKKRKVVLTSFPDFDDNTVALHRRIVGTLDVQVVWLASESSTLPRNVSERATRCVQKNSARGLAEFLSASHVFHTHGIFGSLPPPENQIVTNLWHGMPAKNVGVADGKPPVHSTYTISTSEFYRGVMSESMGVSRESVLMTGQPRTDLFLDTDPSHVRRVLDIPDGKPVIVWLPTYRRSVVGDLRQDGVETETVFPLRDADPLALNELFCSHDAVCLVKPHPMSIHHSKHLQDLSHVRYINQKDLRRRGLLLHEVLAASTALITDVSSILVDYLLLDRPMLFAASDLDVFASGRGTPFASFTNNLAEWLPGRVGQTWLEVLQSIAEILQGTDRFGESRSELRQLFHAETGRASDRILDRVGLV